MKVLGLATSVRKWGNTDLLVHAALNAARAEGAETRMIRVADLELKPCTGCMACVFKEVDCVIPDRLGEVLEALRWSDALVVGAPTYILGANSVLKTLQDRMIGLGQSRELKGKTGMVLAPAGIPGWEPFVLMQLSQLLLFAGMKVIDQFVGYGQGPGEILDGEEAMTRAARGGAALARGENQFLGDEGGCPVCHLDLLTPRSEGRAYCPLCDLEGAWDGKTLTPDIGAHSRFSEEGMHHHFAEGILPSGPRFMAKRKEYAKRIGEFKVLCEGTND
jgi:multimeric flavodoxin WrbA